MVFLFTCDHDHGHCLVDSAISIIESRHSEPGKKFKVGIKIVNGKLSIVNMNYVPSFRATIKHPLRRTLVRLVLYAARND